MKKLTLIALIALSIFACKKEEEVKPQPRQKTVQMATKADFIGKWVGDSLCTLPATLPITDSDNDSTVYLHGVIPCVIDGNSFVGEFNGFRHEATLVNGRLDYCVYHPTTTCCGIFDKEK